MIKQNIVQRLKRLEEQLLPAGAPHEINVVFIEQDGREAPGGFTVTMPSYGPAHDRGRGVRRPSRRP
jgi:hypothetical protein